MTTISETNRHSAVGLLAQIEQLWCLQVEQLSLALRTTQADSRDATSSIFTEVYPMRTLIQDIRYAIALAGVGIGVLAALGLTRYLATLLFEVRPIDLPTFLIVGAALILVALITCVISARRAAKVDPLVALRYE